MNDIGPGNVIKLRIMSGTRRPPARPAALVNYWGLVTGVDGAWCVRIPDVSGCTVRGPTVPSALRLAAWTAGEYVRLEREAGRQMPLPSDMTELVQDSEIALALAVDDFAEFRRVRVAHDELEDLAGQG